MDAKSAGLPWPAALRRYSGEAGNRPEGLDGPCFFPADPVSLGDFDPAIDSEQTSCA
jgi:hypothetical protein